MNIRKALFANKLALAIVLLFVVVRAVLPPGEIDNGLAPASTQGKGRIQAIEKTRLPDLSFEDYAQIAKRNPFGTSSQATGSGEWSLTADSSHSDRSVFEDLGLALSGTVSGSPSVARAIIKDLKTGVFALYKIGQMVGNARIETIEANAVILVHDNQRKVLRINAWQSNSNDNAYVSQSPTDSQITKPAKTALLVKRPDTKIQNRIQQIEKALAKTVIEPYVVDGQTEGLRITGLENIQFAKKIGLKNGDVIRTVNGHLLTSKQKAYQVFKKARSQEAITLELLRSGKPKNLSFALR